MSVRHVLADAACILLCVLIALTHLATLAPSPGFRFSIVPEPTTPPFSSASLDISSAVETLTSTVSGPNTPSTSPMLISATLTVSSTHKVSYAQSRSQRKSRRPTPSQTTSLRPSPPPPVSYAGTWMRVTVNGATFDVRAWGAVGDGRHDDTIAVQAAISSCASSRWGGSVLLPAGFTCVVRGTFGSCRNPTSAASAASPALRSRFQKTDHPSRL